LAGQYKRDDNVRVNAEELEGERKDQFLKRMSKEQKEIEKNNVEKKVWFEVQGTKVVRRALKANGSEYSSYHCSYIKKKDAEEVKKLKEKGLLK